MLTLSSLNCSVDDAEAVGGAADYVLARSDRPAAFTRAGYYTGDEAGEEDRPAVWHGSPAALAQIGVAPGRAVERGDLVAALQGRHAESATKCADRAAGSSNATASR